MPNYNEYQYFEKYIREVINDNAPRFECFLSKVKSFDNLCVSVEIVNNANEIMELSQVPIIQSAYNQPFIQKGDYGIILPLNTSILNSLLEKENLFTQGINEYVFLPLVLKSKAITGAGDNATIQSPNSEIKATINNNGIEIISKSDSLKDNDLSINSKNKISLESADLSIKSDNVTIASSAPLEIGANDTLGSLIGELIDTLSSLTTTNAVVGSPCALNPATITQLATLKAKIQASFK